MKVAQSAWRAAMRAAVVSGLVTGAWRAIRARSSSMGTSHAAPAAAPDARAAQAPPPPAHSPVPAAEVAAAPEIAGVKVPTWRRLYNFMKEAIEAWTDDYAPSMGAALSYYTVFSIAPLLMIVISVAGLVFGEDAARGHVTAQLSGFLGQEGATAIEGLLKSVSLQNKGIVGTAVGAVLLLVGATTVFAELQSALDRIWRVPERDKPQGLIGLLRARLLSFGLILGIGFVMIVSLVASAAMSALGDWWAPLFGGWAILLQVVNFLLSFALVTLVFGMIYKFMPSVHLGWRDVWFGAVATAALFTVGKFLIGLYIGKSGVTSGFGAASSIVLLLIWVYYSAQIYLLGAEFTWVYAHRFGSKKGQEHEVERRSPVRR